MKALGGESIAGLDDDVSAVVGSSFGALSEVQFLTLNLSTCHQYQFTELSRTFSVNIV